MLERLDASPYIYLRLRTTQGEIWAAVPEAKVGTGAEVTIANPMAMGSFESKTLKRTFPEIYFGTLGTPGLPPGHPPMDGGLASHAKPEAKVQSGKVAKAQEADARTISEVWTDRAKLDGKTVTLRGKVVKFNEGILSRNWIHLQDGSGDSAQGTHDITITSQSKVEKGDIVTVKGIIQLKKDFGSGYQYEVLVEGASLSKR
ncbi:MAG TPA: hypothetical protein VJ570_07665 [Holophagaceae bacterium]|nr:hypothetical protein [Holophagaceae bacterium]